MAARVDKKYLDEINQARQELLAILKEKFSAPDQMIRLAYASQFSIAKSHYDDAGKTTSTDATTKTTQSSNNKCLKTIEKIKANHPTITYSDLYQLAGVVAVEALAGPKIEFVPGRTTDSSILPDEGCLPDVKQSPSDLRDAFIRVKIFDPKHIVALCGGLKLARSGVQDSTLKFDNSYFVDLTKDSSLTDKALLDDSEFLHYVNCYAKSEEAFLKDYEEAHKKLSELGLPYSAFIKSTFEKSTSRVKKVLVAQRAVGVGVVVAAAVVILSVFYVINRRRAKQQFQSSI